MIDAHAHMDKYGSALPRALAQIRDQSILTVAVSMDVDSFRETLRVSETEPLLLPSFGIHPWEAPRYAKNLSGLDSFLELSPLFGEIGLDHFFVRDPEHYSAQDAVFTYFLDAAEDQGKIVNIHSKGAERAVAENLERRSLPGVIIHWYSGPLDLVEGFLKLGAYFTVGVEVLRSSHIRELARAIPLDRLLTETDNPGGWEWMEGETGYPDLLNQVERTVAEIRGMERVRLSAQVGRNMTGLLSRGGIAPSVWGHGQPASEP
ncbi:MAG: TatD family hydrolase [Gemmatimonadota bacterium]